MNDSLRTNVFVRFSPETIACACIFLAARQLKIPLPQKPAWWTVFDTTTEAIQAISLEILALYECPKRSLEELEKEIGMLKAQLVKKQVEIKEVNLKKSPSGGETATGSPRTLTPVQRANDDSSSQSPSNAHPNSLPSLPEKESLESQSIEASVVSRSQPVSPIRNGSQKPYKSLSPSPRRQRHRSPIRPPKSNNDRSRSRSPLRRKASPKPINSPIKLSSSSDSLSERSTSPPAADSQENGLPEQYRQDYLYDYEHQEHRSRHKHRSSHKREKRPRESSREKERHSSRHHHRHRERERRREYDQEMYASSKKREKEREREYSRERKIRRTDSRYR